MKVGNRLLLARQDRKLNQAEMADLLGVTPATYSRLERNETSIGLEQVLNFSHKLQIPIQEFLPETVSINNNHHQNGHIGLFMGNIYNYSDQKIAKELELKDKEITYLKREVENLKEMIELLKTQPKK